MKLIIIVGPTASGKTDTALLLAKKFNGGIICADSRTIYKGMDIGTAKPDGEAREAIAHHLLDMINPDQEFSVAAFKKSANQAIKNLEVSKKIPFLVGGTGLYINAVAYDYRLGPKADKRQRQALEKLTLPELQKRAEKLKISSNEVNFLNKRHLIRAVERGGVVKQDLRLRDNSLVLGIDIDQELLKEKIQKRIDDMIREGLEKEVSFLAAKYGFDAPGLDAIGYKEWKNYFSGEITIEELKQNLYKNTWQYARRQKTWFKRDKNIHWVTSVNEASVLVQQFLIQ